MWRLKQSHPPKDQGPLEGRMVDVGKLRLHVKSTIAQGGFSYVYQAKCTQTQRTYALKHIHVNDQEGCNLVEREINVMLSLRGHPHIITLHAHSKLTEGRKVEYFLAMEYCEKMLVNVMDSRGKNFYEEKQLLLIYRDICSAIYAMHSRSPPIAHRDLKAENILLGSDGFWKLCDFGSTSTNHKRFERVEEMGVEEDIIRKHTTPAYRAPEMWDLYTREVISEKVDIWALGCLLYRIAYFKSCFDGESKLQILNGNYRIPETPKYSTGLIGLIRRMLTSSPDKRPDIMQVWREVNELLPSNVRKPAPTPAPGTAEEQGNAGGSQSQPAAPPQLSTRRAASPGRGPRRSPSPGAVSRRPASPGPPSRRAPSPPVSAPAAGAGSFWATQFAPQVPLEENTSPPISSPGNRSPTHPLFAPCQPTLERQVSGSPREGRGEPSAEPGVRERGHEDGDKGRGAQAPVGHAGGSGTPQDFCPQHLSPKKAPNGGPLIEDFFSDGYRERQRQLVGGEAGGQRSQSSVSQVASPLHPQPSEVRGEGSSWAGAEVESLREQLGRAQAEKAELEAKCDRLANMVRSQRAEIQELKGALAATDKGVPAGTATPRHSPTYSNSPSSGKLGDDGTSGGVGNAVESANGGSQRAPSPDAEEKKPSLWLRPQDLGKPIPLSDAQAFGSPADSELRASKSLDSRLSGQSKAAGWQAFDESSTDFFAGSRGFEASGTNRSSPSFKWQQPSSDWATFQDVSNNDSQSKGLSHGLRRGTAGPPPVQWETITVSAGKATSCKTSSQPAGWAGF